jgi:hypothetical protein
VREKRKEWKEKESKEKEKKYRVREKRRKYGSLGLDSNGKVGLGRARSGWIGLDRASEP